MHDLEVIIDCQESDDGVGDVSPSCLNQAATVYAPVGLSAALFTISTKYLNKNLIETQVSLNLSYEEVKTLLVNSFKSSFLKDTEKKKWISKI